MVRQRSAAYDRVVTRVLLVEDDHDIAEPLARALTREGYEVDSAGDGSVALQTVLDAPPDLIILDIGLPGMDGLEVCRLVRELRPQVPILMLTARDGELETVAGLDAGADDYVTKPFRLSELLARVRAMLRRSAPPELVAGAVRVDEASRPAGPPAPAGPGAGRAPTTGCSTSRPRSSTCSRCWCAKRARS
jgi:DNA-binding response OmpR family regulator